MTSHTITTKVTSAYDGYYQIKVQKGLKGHLARSANSRKAVAKHTTKACLWKMLHQMEAICKKAACFTSWTGPSECPRHKEAY